ncbi:MAG: nucleotidyltransferase domain-containing protein [Spirochaetales bacterium]|nr:nucleotidyltransferase domain-containing protein [Spirochaetales bacterium]
MRLQENEKQAIKESFLKIFSPGKIYLFGSRVDDDEKGGDIDLFIETADLDHLREKKIDFLVELKSRIGDQKIDLVISKDESRIIEQEALKEGILL